MIGWVVQAVGSLAFGAAVGALVVPQAADALLGRAYRRSRSWWWDSFRLYRAARKASRRAGEASADEGGPFAAWLDDSLRAAGQGTLARERAIALRGEGLPADPERAVRTERQQKERCSFAPTRRRRAACAAAGAVAGAALAAADLPWASALAAGVCATAMLVAVACDLKARMIPLECCAALAAAGGALQALAAGPAGLAAGLVFAAVAAGACLAANRVAGRGRALPVGHGDIRCMAALSLATGAAAPAGLLACYMSAAAFSLAGLAARRLTLRSGIPMAPFLSLWLACGVACLAC